MGNCALVTRGLCTYSLSLRMYFSRFWEVSLNTRLCSLSYWIFAGRKFSVGQSGRALVIMVKLVCLWLPSSHSSAKTVEASFCKEHVWETKEKSVLGLTRTMFFTHRQTRSERLLNTWRLPCPSLSAASPWSRRAPRPSQHTPSTRKPWTSLSECLPCCLPLSTSCPHLDGFYPCELRCEDNLTKGSL